MTYTIKETNKRPSDATGISVSDIPPSGVTFKSADTHGMGTYNRGTGIWSGFDLANGVSAILTLVLTVNSTVVDGTILTKKPTVSGQQTDLDPTNNSTQTTTKAVQVKRLGGEVVVVNKLSVLAPWIVLAFVLSIGGVILVLKRR